MLIHIFFIYEAQEVRPAAAAYQHEDRSDMSMDMDERFACCLPFVLGL